MEVFLTYYSKSVKFNILMIKLINLLLIMVFSVCILQDRQRHLCWRMKRAQLQINLNVVGNKTPRSQLNFKSSYIKKKDQKKHIQDSKILMKRHQRFKSSYIKSKDKKTKYAILWSWSSDIKVSNQVISRAKKKIYVKV